MLEVIREAFAAVNLPLTVLLIITVLYWLGTILGAFGMESADADVDADVDVGMDVDTDVDADVDVDAGADLDAEADVGADADAGGDGVNIGWAFLRFFHFGDIPVMVLASILVVSLWFFSMLGNHYFNAPKSGLLALPVIAVSLLISLAVVKITGVPLSRAYGMLNRDYNAPKKVVGRLATVVTTTVSDRLGQVSVRTRGAPIVLNAVTEGGAELKKGDEAVVVRRDKERGIYIVAPTGLDS